VSEAATRAAWASWAETYDEFARLVRRDALNHVACKSQRWRRSTLSAIALTTLAAICRLRAAGRMPPCRPPKRR
jgi:hypothetical protein